MVPYILLFVQLVLSTRIFGLPLMFVFQAAFSGFERKIDGSKAALEYVQSQK